MNIKIPKSFLLSGNDLKLTPYISVKHPTLEEILNIDISTNGFNSEEIYYSWVNIFLVDPYSYMVYLDNKNLDFENVEPFDLFVMLYKDYIENFNKIISNISKENNIFDNIYFSAFKFFLNIDSFLVAKDENGEIVLADKERNFLMDRKIFSYISEFIKEINGIQNLEQINPEDNFAKRILIDDEKEKLKKSINKHDKNEKESNRIGNLISAVTWAEHSNITPFNRNKLHIYDLIDGVKRINKILDYKNTMIGLYSGCIDKKNINFDKIHWSN